jgi:CheY-like chemotaxis protein
MPHNTFARSFVGGSAGASCDWTPPDSAVLPARLTRLKTRCLHEILPWVRNLGIISERISPKLHLRDVTLMAHRSPAARILVVDDNAAMRLAMRKLLEMQHDWKVCDEASDGGEAIAKFDKEKFDVIVLDFQMPGMNGLDAARQIASRSPDTPILMVTLHHSPQLAEEARKIGIRGICTKADIGSVVEGVKTLLDNKPYFKN